MLDAWDAPCLSCIVSRKGMSPRNVIRTLPLSAFTIVLVILASCSKPPNSAPATQPTRAELLALWRAPETPVGQKQDAANVLLKTNM
jgi:hypothetical protein